MRAKPRARLLPYTTLFRSRGDQRELAAIDDSVGIGVVPIVEIDDEARPRRSSRVAGEVRVRSKDHNADVQPPRYRVCLVLLEVVAGAVRPARRRDDVACRA